MVAILSWTFTCLLCHHPIGASAWSTQHGKVSDSYYQISDRLGRASYVGLNTISAIGISMTSAIGARAAASYCQLNSSRKMKIVTMRQMLALADKGWSSIGHVRDLLRPRTYKAVTTPLLTFVMSLIITGKVITHRSGNRLTYPK